MTEAQKTRIQELRDMPELTVGNIRELGNLEKIEMAERIRSTDDGLAAKKVLDVAKGASEDLSETAERTALRLKEEADRVAEELKKIGGSIIWT
jgi:hypothetical protein